GAPAGRGLRGDPRGDGRPAGRGPPPRSSAPRVPPQPDGTGARDPPPRVGGPVGGRPAADVVGGGPLGGGQPDARSPGRPAGADVPRAVPAAGRCCRPGAGAADPG